MRDALPKGLVPKYAVGLYSSKEAAEECHRLRAIRIEYAQDDEGRIWRRIKREKPGPRWTQYTEMVRWHVADMYAWFPGEDLAKAPGVRRQNRAARPPAKLDVYLVDDKPMVLLRPDYEFSEQ